MHFLSVSNKHSTEKSNKDTEIPDELVSLISKAESNIPEVLSMIEKTDKSGSTIQKTISEVKMTFIYNECEPEIILKEIRNSNTKINFCILLH